ncbi:MAG: hypothetical protein R3B70_31175 [Polyangiaceae bacterium]
MEGEVVQHPEVTAIASDTRATFAGGLAVSSPVSAPVPSCPRELFPHASTVPSARSAKVVSQPALTAIAPDTPFTWTGVLLSSTVPSPSCPTSLRPQAHTVPSDLTATLWSSPAAMAVTPDRPATWTGVFWSGKKLPLPTCPFAVAPHPQTVPSLLSARLCRRPPATATTPERPVTATGWSCAGGVCPFPSWP